MGKADDVAETVPISDAAALREAGYEIEAPDTPFTVDYATQHVVVGSPSGGGHVLGCAGPARSGTTGLLFMLASHPGVDEAYFQPLTTLLRLGGPDLVLGGSAMTCIKEVYRGCCVANDHDPIAMLLNAGVPSERITWITILRDPVSSYASWQQHIAGSTPQNFADAQSYALHLHRTYSDAGLNMIPFAYDLLEGDEATVLAAVLERTPLVVDGPMLDFDLEAIDRKMSYGQAEDASYFNMSVKPTLDRGRLTYDTDGNTLPPAVAREVSDLCQAEYEEFRSLCRRELHL